MICYRDMTFCNSWKDCKKSDDCGRALTPEVQEGADKWWSTCEGSAPICTYVGQPDCHEINDWDGGTNEK